jgi:hypothetical protein
MAILKYTAIRDTWGKAIKAGESFTVDQGTNAPSGQNLVLHLRKMGREIKSSSSIGGNGGMNVGQVVTSNEWIIERIK